MTTVGAAGERRTDAAALDGRFVDVKPVPGLDSPFQDASPSLTADGLTIVFSSGESRGGHGNFDVWMSTRGSTNGPFGAPINLGPTVNTEAIDSGPSLSAEGLSLYFYSNRAGGSGSWDLYTATRNSRTESFGPAMHIPLFSVLTNEGANSPFADRDPSPSADNQMLYFASDRIPGRSGGPGTLGGLDLWVVSRGSTGDVLAGLTNLGPGVNSAFDEGGPAVSADGLAVFFDSDNRPGGEGDSDLWVATRPTPDAEFGPAVNLNDFGLGSAVNSSDGQLRPFVSHDWPAAGSKLYFMQYAASPDPLRDPDWDLYQATWVPEPATAALLLFGAAVAFRRRLAS